MFLKINFNIFVILHLTLLISFISADNNDEFNLRKQLARDLKDTNSDLKWWEYFLSSETKENKNLIPLKTAESSASFDVVQTHLTDEEIPDEEELPFTTRAPATKSRPSFNTPKRPAKRPTVIVTTTERTVEISNQQPRKTIQTRPATKRPTLASTTTSSVDSDEDEELDNNKILIKPVARKPIPQPTKSKSTGSKDGGVKTRQPKPVFTSRPISTTSRPIITTTKSEEDDEPLPTIQPAPRKPQTAKTPTKTIQTTTRRPIINGVKRPSLPAKPVISSFRPTIKTTTRSSVTKESEEDDDEELPERTLPTPQQPRVPAPQPTKQPIGGAKTKQLTTKKVRIQTTTSKPALIDEDEDDETEKKIVNKINVQPFPRKINPAPVRPQPQGGVKTRPTSRPTSRPISRPVTRPTTTISKSDKDDTGIKIDKGDATTTSRPISPIQKMTGVKKPIQTGTKTKKKQSPTKISPRPIITTSRPIVEENDEETIAPVTQPRKTIQVTTSKPIINRPTGGVKRPTQPGTKTRITPAVKLEPKNVPTTAKSLIEDDSDVGNPLSRSIPTVRPNIPKTPTTRRPVIIEEDEEEENEINVPRKSVPQPAPRPKIGTKTPVRPQIGTKTKPLPTKTSSRPATTTLRTTTVEEDSEDETTPPAKLVPRLPSLRPQTSITTRRPLINEEDDDEEEPSSPKIPSPRPAPQRPQTPTTRRPAITEDEEDEENETVPRKPVPQPLPKGRIGTKTPARPSGTKTLPTPPRPSGTKGGVKTKKIQNLRPVITTTLKSTTVEEDEEDKSSVLPKSSTARPQIVTTTKKTAITEEDDEDETEEPLPTSKRPSPSPRITTQRPQIQTTTTTRATIIEDEEDEENEINVPRKPVPQPLPKGRIGTKTPARPVGTKTKSQQPVFRPTSNELDTEDETEAPKTIPRRPVPAPQPRKIVPKKTTTSLSEDEEEDEEEENIKDVPTTRRPIPSPLPRSKVIGTKTKVGTKTISTQSPFRPRLASTTTSTTTALTEEDNDDSDIEELPTSTSRPAIVQPRATTQRPRGVKTPTGTKTRVTPQPRLTTSASLEENIIEEKTELPEIKQPSRPSLSGRKVVNRVTSSSPVETTDSPTTPNVVTTPRRVVSKTRIESMPVPRPVSFSRRRTGKISPPKEEETPIEATTLEPIPVPAFEPTRRSSTRPIIQSISVDNEEDNEELPRKKSAVKNAERVIYSSDLAKFSSRVKFAERPSNMQIRSQFSYSPPLIEPNNESFIEINRIK